MGTDEETHRFVYLSKPAKQASMRVFIINREDSLALVEKLSVSRAIKRDKLPPNISNLLQKELGKDGLKKALTQAEFLSWDDDVWIIRSYHTGMACVVCSSKYYAILENGKIS